MATLHQESYCKNEQFIRHILLILHKTQYVISYHKITREMRTLYNLINVCPKMFNVFHILQIFHFYSLSLLSRKPIRNDSTCDCARIPNIVFSFEVTEALNIPQNTCMLSNYSFLYISKFNEAFMMSLLPIEKPLFIDSSSPCTFTSLCLIATFIDYWIMVSPIIIEQ